jgi:hypothetical protein
MELRARLPRASLGATRTFFIFNQRPGLVCYMAKSLTMRDAARDTG